LCGTSPATMGVIKKIFGTKVVFTTSVFVLINFEAFTAGTEKLRFFLLFGFSYQGKYFTDVGFSFNISL